MNKTKFTPKTNLSKAQKNLVKSNNDKMKRIYYYIKKKCKIL